jgi:hypothetical protein
MNRMFVAVMTAVGFVLGGTLGWGPARSQDHPPAPHPPPPKTVVSRPEPEPEPPKPPKPDEPDDLRPIARAAITLVGGEPVPKVWPLGVPLAVTSARSIAGGLPQSSHWDIQPPWVDRWSQRSADGKQIHLATGTKPKIIRVTLQVAKDDTFDTVTVTVVVRPDPMEPGDRVPPEPKPPGPDEPMPPEPVPPDQPTPPPLAAMAQQVKDLALKHITDIASRKDKVLALAASHEKIAGDVSQAVAGVPAYAHLKQPKAIVDATVASNRAAVGDREPYVSFFNALNAEVLKPIATTTLATAGGHIGVWQDIAAGLRAAVP